MFRDSIRRRDFFQAGAAAGLATAFAPSALAATPTGYDPAAKFDLTVSELEYRRTARGRAVFGALTGLSALAALFLGVLLAGLTSTVKRRRVGQHQTADEGKPPCVMTPSRWSGQAARRWSRFPVMSASRTWTSSGTGSWP